MKSLTILFFMLSSSLAFAMPSVGDEVQFDIFGSMYGAPVHYIYGLKLTELDEATDLFTEVTSLDDDSGAHIENSRKIARASLINDAMIKGILDDCKTPLILETPAGNFDACPLPIHNAHQSGTGWVGNVPYGILKSVITADTGEVTTVILRSFKNGH